MEVETFKSREDESDAGENDKIFIRLAHYSVKEFLVLKRILQGHARSYNIQEANAYLSIHNDCLAYLLEFDNVNQLTSHFLAEFLLARYAAKYWTQHAYLAKRDIGIKPLLSVEFFFTKGDSLLNWIRLYNPEEP